jgi:hypothetical protein
MNTQIDPMVNLEEPIEPIEQIEPIEPIEHRSRAKLLLENEFVRILFLMILVNIWVICFMAGLVSVVSLNPVTCQAFNETIFMENNVTTQIVFYNTTSKEHLTFQQSFKCENCICPNINYKPYKCEFIKTKNTFVKFKINIPWTTIFFTIAFVVLLLIIMQSFILVKIYSQTQL